MLQVGDTAPGFSLQAVDGQQYSLDSKLTLAIFFKTTCPTCQYGWPFYERLHQAYTSAGLQVWGISQHNREKTDKYVSKYGATFPHLLDEGLKVSQEYDPEFVPTGFLIDAERQIIAAFASWNREQLNQLAQRIAELLQVPPQQIVRAEDNAIAFKPG